MKRFGWVLVVLTLLTAVPAGAQSPKPHATPTSAAMSKKIPVTNLSNPGNRSNNAGTMSGQGCISGPTANRAQTTVNPINGHAQAATIVSVPLGKGSGSVASATTRQQQAQACAHTH
jgi:hypothetical protein